MPLTQLISLVEQVLRSAGRRLVDRVPSLWLPLRFCWNLYAAVYIQCVTVKHRLLRPAGTAIDPCETIEVDPDRVQRRVANTEKSKFKYAGAVSETVGEDVGERFDELRCYQSLVAHFEDGVPWTETELYREATEQITDGDRLWGCDTVQDFHERCAKLDELYETIAEDGYQSQRELAAGAGSEPITNRRFFLQSRIVNDEINICLGPDGECLFIDGRNRLTIAKILDLDSVPVCVLARHADWQRKRARLANGDLRPEDLSPAERRHPDLQKFCEMREKFSSGYTYPSSTSTMSSAASRASRSAAAALSPPSSVARSSTRVRVGTDSMRPSSSSTTSSAMMAFRTASLSRCPGFRSWPVHSIVSEPSVST